MAAPQPWKKSKTGRKNYINSANKQLRSADDILCKILEKFQVPRFHV